MNPFNREPKTTYHVGYMKDSEFWSTYESDLLDDAKRFATSQQKHYDNKKLLVVKKISIFELVD